MNSFQKRLLLAGVLTFLLGITADETRAEPDCLTLKHLTKLSECELNRLFEQAPPGAIPLGYSRGRVLRMQDARLPRLQARLASGIWKGKHFEEDGAFINQWPGFTALRSKAEMGISSLDGKPCIVIEYPLETPLFGNNRDELREIAPGLYLARLYERCPCPRFRGYFAIQVECGK
jgi:hypothetical protein